MRWNGLQMAHPYFISSVTTLAVPPIAGSKFIGNVYPMVFGGHNNINRTGIGLAPYACSVYAKSAIPITNN